MGNHAVRSPGDVFYLHTPRILTYYLSCLLLFWKRFKWDVKKFKPHFTISPEEGYITSGMEVALEVTYHPTEIGKESLYKNILCFIQGGNPLCLTLSGICVGPPAVKEASRHWPGMGKGGRKPNVGIQASSPASNIQSCSSLPQGLRTYHTHYLNNLSSLFVYLIPVLSSTCDTSITSSRQPQEDHLDQILF